LALAVPCSAQLGVILGMLGTLSLKAAAIWAGVVLGVLLLVGFLSSKIVSGSTGSFILEIPPMRVPRVTNIAVKTMARLEWYIREAVPLFMIATFTLFILSKLGVMMLMIQAGSPVIVGLLGLPEKATEAFFIGFFRRDYGAAGLFALSKQGLLDPIQMVVSMVTITLFVPCVAQFFVTIKERGLKTALMISGFIFPFAFFVGGVLNFLLRYLEVSL
ncbi:MAG: nucleoside recognition domain-containing protein, partial [Candidatus Hydrothermarchaeaceae archaeon]